MYQSMNIKSLTLAVSALVLSTSVNAAMINIDFEEINNSTGNVYGRSSLDTQGFNLTNDGTQDSKPILYWGSDKAANADPGGVTFTHNHANSTTILTQINGDAFDLFSIDFADVWNLGTSQDIKIDAVTASGLLLSTVITIDEAIDLETFNFNWSNITSASWTEKSEKYLQLDNIVVGTSVVPVPAAVWLFGSGLIGLIGMARSRKTS